jgi:mono/diheme cytochrome c family protein
VAGAQVFREKGCIGCHSPNFGAELAAAAGTAPSRSSLPRLVTAMWNHAPRMWQRMQVEKVDYPELDYREMAQIVAYLCLSGYVDRAGDVEHGRQLFAAKGCVRCHEVRGIGTRQGLDLNVDGGAATPMIWTQVMWNHAAEMQERMRQLGISWPHFEEDELRDLYAYVRPRNQPSSVESEMAPADPENGWRVFQSKGCISCHVLNPGAGGHIGQDLGPDGEVPPTFFRFAGSMLNHFPKMRGAVTAQHVPPATFQGREMADMIAFIYSLRYLEPGGSPHVGQSVFVWRGCDRCHGRSGEGTGSGPALRGRGQTYAAVRLATVLWAHGARMYQRSQEMNQEWPQLEPSDVGDMLAFLNAPVK